MGKVHRSPQGGGYLPVPGKLLSVVRRQAAALHSLKQTDQGSLNGGCSLVFDLCRQQQAACAVNHSNQVPSPRFAQDGVHLPVSDLMPLLNFPGAKLNGNGVLNAPPAILPCFPPVGLTLATPLQDRQVFSRLKGQSTGFHGPIDRGYGYLKGLSALDLFWRPAFFKTRLQNLPQSFVFQLEGRPTAFTTQTIEFTGFVGTVGSLDEIALEFPADCRRTSIQGSGNLSYSVSLSTKAQYTFSFCCCKMVATHGCQSPSLFVLCKLILANNCHLWAFYLLSPPTVAFRL